MVKAYICIQMAQNMKVTGLMTSKMVMVKKFGQTVLVIKGNMKTEKNKEKEY